MLYTRSSFLTWLRKVHNCEITPIEKSPVLIIENGVASARIWTSKKDLIDYEEIHRVCNVLYIVGLPGDKDLKKIE